MGWRGERTERATQVSSAERSGPGRAGVSAGRKGLPLDVGRGGGRPLAVHTFISGEKAGLRREACGPEPGRTPEP